METSSSFLFSMPGNNLSGLLATQRFREIPRQYSGARVYYLPDSAAYLKVGDRRRNIDLDREKSVLLWLSARFHVPRVIDFEERDEMQYLLISEVRGLPCSDCVTALDDGPHAIRLLEIVAARIRQLHDLDIAGCPFDQTLVTKMEKATANIQGGFVLESDFDTENHGKSAAEVYDELVAERPPDEDLVFTHGDLCLPNIIIDQDKVSGVIDLDRGGVADRYQDLALFLRSFAHNCGTPVDVDAAFCRGYGISSVDKSKLDFYRKLDELF